MCYIFITFQGRASFWGEPEQAFAPVVSSLCFRRLDIRERMLAASKGQEAKRRQLKPRRTADCQGLRVIRRLENWAWKEVETGLASEARRQSWQWPRRRNSLVQWSWLPKKRSLAIFRVLSSCPGFWFQGGSIQLASLCLGPSLTQLYPQGDSGTFRESETGKPEPSSCAPRALPPGSHCSTGETWGTSMLMLMAKPSSG